MNKRLRYFDIAKGMGMVLVLVGHLQGEILNLSPYIIYLCTWIFSFHMPLFFIISGMLIRYKGDEKKDFGLLVRKRFQGIMVPYYLFSIIYIFIVLWGMFVDKIVPLSTLLVNIWYVLGLYGMNVLWFLPAMFMGELLFLFIIKRFSKRNSLLLIIGLTVIAYFLNLLLKGAPFETAVFERFKELCVTLLRPVFACSFIMIGYLSFDIVNEGTKSRVREFLPAVLFFVINVICIYVSMQVLHYNNVGEFRSLVHNNVFVYYLAACSGSAFIILISKFLSGFKYSFPLLAFYGTNSLVFMAVHNNSKVLTFALRSSMYINQYLTRAR